MVRNVIFAGAVIAAALGSWVAFSPEPEKPSQLPAETGAPLVAVSLPATLSPEAKMGQRAFEAICAECHGKNAAGRNEMGPPLVHKIYEPSHHGDESFQRAVAVGVRAHHWAFGNMPAVEGFTRADVKTIIAYVRELQRANGIQ